MSSDAGGALFTTYFSLLWKCYTICISFMFDVYLLGIFLVFMLWLSFHLLDCLGVVWRAGCRHFNLEHIEPVDFGLEAGRACRAWVR